MWRVSVTMAVYIQLFIRCWIIWKILSHVYFTFKVTFLIFRCLFISICTVFWSWMFTKSLGSDWRLVTSHLTNKPLLSKLLTLLMCMRQTLVSQTAPDTQLSVLCCETHILHLIWLCCVVVCLWIKGRALTVTLALWNLTWQDSWEGILPQSCPFVCVCEISALSWTLNSEVLVTTGLFHHRSIIYE